MRSGRAVSPVAWARTALSIALLLASAASTLAHDSAPPPPVLHERAWLLMGTAFEAKLYAPDSAGAAGALDAALRAAARVDSLMSLYRPSSELVRVNRTGFGEPVPISGELFAVLEEARALRERTDGAFDVTVKPAMDAWGFYRKAGHVPGAAACDSLAALIDARGVILDRAARTVRLDRAGMSIDLGGIAKGYALDEAARALRARGVTAALLNLGGNILAIGAPPGESGWPVGILDPRSPDSLFTILTLADCSVSSSGGYEKFVVLDGVRYGHIVDPRTARPVVGIFGTSVIAADGTTADALSTALHVLGADGVALLSSRFEVTGLLVAGESNGRPWIVGTGPLRP